MEKGLPFDVIPELEESEFYDWLAASQALDIDRKLIMMNSVSTPHMKNNDRNSLYNSLRIERDGLLGESVSIVSEQGIQRTRERLKKQGRVKKTNAIDNDKRDTRKTKT